MILFESGFGILRNVPYNMMKDIIEILPDDWGYTCKCTYDSSIRKESSKYKLKFFRKDN